MRDFLNGWWGERGSWDIHQPLVSKLIAVGPDEEVEVAEVGGLLVNGIAICVLSWSLNRGTCPNPWEFGVRVKLVGLPIVLCNEQGIAFAVTRIGKVELESCSFISANNLLAVEALLWMASPVELPPVISLSFEGTDFVIRVLSWPLETWQCRSSQEKLGHPRSQAEVEDDGGAHAIRNSNDPPSDELAGQLDRGLLGQVAHSNALEGSPPRTT